MATCFLPQHLRPPLGPAASSAAGPMAPWVTAQVLCEHWPLRLLCHCPAAFSLSTDVNRFLSHLWCQPDTTLLYALVRFLCLLLLSKVWRVYSTFQMLQNSLKLNFSKNLDCPSPWSSPYSSLKANVFSPELEKMKKVLLLDALGSVWLRKLQSNLGSVK